MAMPKKGLRKLVINQRRYFASVSGGRINESGDVPISFVVHPDGNDRAKLIVKGITSRDYWYDFPDTEKTQELGVAITPKNMVCVIEHCLAEGWDPDGTGQTNFSIDNEKLAAIVDAD